MCFGRGSVAIEMTSLLNLVIDCRRDFGPKGFLGGFWEGCWELFWEGFWEEFWEEVLRGFWRRSKT